MIPNILSISLFSFTLLLGYEELSQCKLGFTIKIYSNQLPFEFERLVNNKAKQNMRVFFIVKTTMYTIKQVNTLVNTNKESFRCVNVTSS